MIPQAPFLCFITDDALSPVALTEQALRGGAAMIQLRHKSASSNQLFSWAVEIRKLCRNYGATLIINDRADIALASQADGVHLGQQDLPAAAARKLLGKKYIIGVSASSPSEAVQAERDGADYIGFGHIFPTSSKEKAFLPLGPESLGQVASLVTLPIIAIGGIHAENAASLISLGASAVAVISAISRATNPLQTALELTEAIKRRVE